MNNDYRDARALYELILNNNGYSKITMIYAISCIEESLQAYDMDLIVSDEDKEKMCNIVLDFWLDCEFDISIGRIADIVVEHWSDLKDSDNYAVLNDYLNF